MGINAFFSKQCAATWIALLQDFEWVRVESLSIGWLKRQRSHNIERIKATCGFMRKRKADGLGDIPVIHAAKQQPEAILVEITLRHKHPEAQRHGCNPPLARIDGCHFLAELFGHPVNVPWKQGIIFIHNAPCIRGCARTVAVNAHR